jgi:hypothetical protein
MSVISGEAKFLGDGRWGWVHLLRRPLPGLLYQPRMINDHVAFDRIRIGKGNRSTRRGPAPLPLYPPQIPHNVN